MADPLPLPPLMITAAICGAEVFRDQTPYVPYTPAELAEEAVRCHAAGATMVHLHVRQPDGTPSQSAELFAEAKALIQARCPILVQFSTGGAVGMSVAERADALKLRPDMATLTTGSVNFGDDIFANATPMVRQIAQRMQEFGVRPEIECFDTGIVRSARMFRERGMLRDPVHISLVMGVASGMAADPRWLPLLVDEMPKGAIWQVIAIGRQEVWALHRAAVRLGGHLRTGLEDTFYLPDGTKTDSNGRLVAALAEVVREAGCEVASAEEAREIMGIYRYPSKAA